MAVALNKNADFDLDLKHANFREEHLAKILTGKTIELKTDFLVVQTGNFYIEYESRGMPSSLAISKADYWMLEIENHDTYILIETERLRKLCRLAYKLRKIAKGGDYLTSWGVLLPFEWLSKSYEEIENKEL